MRKEKEYKLAIDMRRSGSSLNEICRKLNISKSTASIWLRQLPLDSKAKRRLASRTKVKSINGLLQYSKQLRQNKLKAEKVDANNGLVKLGTLSDRDIYCVGLGLYWGEGYKKGNQEFGFTNSDERMILFYIKWLGVVFGVSLDELIARVSINELHGNRVDQVVAFWSNTTGIKTSQFTKTSLIRSKSKKSYKDLDSHMGTLRIKVKKGTRMRREVIGAIRGLVV